MHILVRLDEFWWTDEEDMMRGRGKEAGFKLYEGRKDRRGWKPQN